MTDIFAPAPGIQQTAIGLSPRAPVLFGLAAGLGVVGLFLVDDRWRLTLWFVALSLAVLGAVIIGFSLWGAARRRANHAAFDAMFRFDTDAVVLSDSGGRIEVQNDAARARFGLTGGDQAMRLLEFSAAAPAELYADLRRAALSRGRSDATGELHVGTDRLVVMRAGRDGLLWRFAAPEPQVATEEPDEAPVPVDPAALVPDDPGQDRYFENLPVPILQIAADGKVDRANRRARQLLDDMDIVGQGLASVVEGLGRPVRDWLADAFDGRGLHRPEVVRLTPGKVDRYLQITLGQIGQEDGVKLVAVLHDATELKTLEAQFVQSQKMQAIGQLAGGVAHDFNNLLTAISGHCDLLLLRRDEMDPDFADLEQINQNANRAASLVGQLLAFSRKQNLRPEYLDLRLTLAELTHLLNRLVGEKVHLSFSHDPALLPIRADKRQLEQVIMNLVVNARDAMRAGGKITIETQAETLAEPMARDRVIVPAGVYVTVRVRDQGVGITPDKLPKIFEPFFTTKKAGEGTGLGLSTAYGIVKQTGGFIFADSTPGEGSCFTLYFPAHRAEEGAAVKVADARPAKSIQVGDGVVLLVEDEAPVRAFASRALRLRGYTVIEAENGEEAMTILEDSTLRVDIFVTDVIMPGMDGPSWVKEALMTRPETKVVFVSGYSEENLSETQANIPNSVFLPKPFSLTQLTSTVQDQLR
ncbi:hybrid sensor histidine kinase/response regulator [Oceaniglobus trochenteri]|uniref:hybrid sensor histidine kinase/response regulator n=1 Tax=Oceaniglobus trochenteri TaxID=2763260 RepID=UPI001CFF7821|nr:ATP-binding protein [Oceaniglobus trochenteri]